MLVFITFILKFNCKLKFFLFFQLQSKIDTLQKALDEHNNELSLTDKSVHLTKVGKDSALGMGEMEKLIEVNYFYLFCILIIRKKINNVSVCRKIVA